MYSDLLAHLNPEQREAVTLPPVNENGQAQSALILAGAGGAVKPASLPPYSLVDSDWSGIPYWRLSSHIHQSGRQGDAVTPKCHAANEYSWHVDWHFSWPL